MWDIGSTGRAIGTLAVTLALAGAADARAAQPAAATGIEAVANLRSAPGETTRALVRLSSRPGNEPRGVLMALLVPAVQAVHVALSNRPCSARTSTYVVMAEAVVAPDGTAYRETGFHFASRQLQRARSVVLLGDTGDDGVDEVLACGPLAKVRTGGRSGRAAPRLGTAMRLGSKPRFLMTMLLGTTYGGGVWLLTGADPGVEYRLGVSPRSCGAQDMAPLTTLARLRSDARGAGHASFTLSNTILSGLRRARSVSLTRPFPDGLVLTACAPLSPSF